MLAITNEVLQILQEECAEVVQAASKCVRFGMKDPANVRRLTSEIGDLLAMIEILQEFDMIEPQEVTNAALHKREKLKVFSSIFNN